MKGKLMKKIGIKLSTVFAVTMVAVMAVPFVALADRYIEEESNSLVNVGTPESSPAPESASIEGELPKGEPLEFKFWGDNGDEVREAIFNNSMVDGVDYTIEYSADNLTAIITFLPNYLDQFEVGDTFSGVIEVSNQGGIYPESAYYRITIIEEKEDPIDDNPEPEPEIEEDPTYDDPTDDIILDPSDLPEIPGDTPFYVRIKDRDGNPTSYVAYVEPVTTNVSYSSPKTGEDMSYNYVVAALSMLALSSLAIIAKINRA